MSYILFNIWSDFKNNLMTVEIFANDSFLAST